MSGFREMVQGDIGRVFLDDNAFADRRTVILDGETFTDIRVLLCSMKDRVREVPNDDHVQGLYLATANLHCSADDLGGKLPEKGQKLQINDREGGGGFFQSYYVASSVCEMGMLKIGLEAIDE